MKSNGRIRKPAREAAGLLIPVTREEYLILSLLRNPQSGLSRQEEINQVVPRMQKALQQVTQSTHQRKERGIPSAERIAAFFSLTRAESSVSELLTRGLTLKQIAAARNVSPCTVREQLRKVYLKTGYRTQRDLVAAILRLVP